MKPLRTLFKRRQPINDADQAAVLPEKAAQSQEAAMAERICRQLVRKYTLESMWPASPSAPLSELLLRMAEEISGVFGKRPEDFSLDDLNRAEEKIGALGVAFDLSALKLGRLKRGIAAYQQAAPVMEIASFLYCFGNMFVGNFGPLVRKLGVNSGGSALARASGVWFCGQCFTALYWDPQGVHKKYLAGDLEEFEPVFDSLSLDQYRELAGLLGLNALCSWDRERLRQELLSALRRSSFNRLQALYARRFSYQEVLRAVARELKIPDLDPGQDAQRLEERIVLKVLAEHKDQLKLIPQEKLSQVMKQSGKNDGGRTLWTKGGIFTTLLGSRLLGVAIPGAASPWIIGAAGVSLIVEATKAKPQAAIPFILYLGVMRERLLHSEKATYSWWRRLLHKLRALVIYRRWRIGQREPLFGASRERRRLAAAPLTAEPQPRSGAQTLR